MHMAQDTQPRMMQRQNAVPCTVDASARARSLTEARAPRLYCPLSMLVDVSDARAVRAAPAAAAHKLHIDVVAARLARPQQLEQDPAPRPAHAQAQQGQGRLLREHWWQAIRAQSHNKHEQNTTLAKKFRCQCSRASAQSQNVTTAYPHSVCRCYVEPHSEVITTVRTPG